MAEEQLIKELEKEAQMFLRLKFHSACKTVLEWPKYTPGLNTNIDVQQMHGLIVQIDADEGDVISNAVMDCLNRFEDGIELNDSNKLKAAIEKLKKIAEIYKITKKTFDMDPLTAGDRDEYFQKSLKNIEKDMGRASLMNVNDFEPQQTIDIITTSEPIIIKENIIFKSAVSTKELNEAIENEIKKMNNPLKIKIKNNVYEIGNKVTPIVKLNKGIRQSLDVNSLPKYEKSDLLRVLHYKKI